MSKTLKFYLYFIITIGFTILFYSIFHLFSSNYNYLGIILFCVLSITSEYLAVNMEHGSISVGFAINLSSILIFGPLPASLVAGTGMILRVRNGNLLELKKILFNVSALAITTGSAGYIYIITGGNPGILNLPRDLIPISFTIITYFVINNITMTIVMSLAQKANFCKIWKDNLRWLVPNYLALGALGILIAGIYLDLGAIAILLFFIPLALARQSFKMYLELKDIHLATVQALISTIEAKDPYTKGHSERVAKLGAKLARKMNYSEKEIEKIKYAGFLHDVGKISLQNEILNKPGELNESEYEIVKEHPKTGAEIIKNVKYLNDVADYVKYHHERLNGTGYPEGLTEEEIPMGACILAVADVYDALTSDRPYRDAWPRDKALNKFREDNGECFDPRVVEALLEISEERKKIS